MFFWVVLLVTFVSYTHHVHAAKNFTLSVNIPGSPSARLTISVEERMAGGNTALHYAARNNDIEEAKDLVRRGAFLNVRNDNKAVPCDCAPENSKTRRFLQACMKLFDAVRSGDIDGLNDALKAGGYVNAQDKFGKTPLHAAACLGNTAIARALIKAGADINILDTYGCTCLHRALCADHVETVRCLVAAGCDVNHKDGNGFAPLDYAEDEEIIKILYEPWQQSKNTQKKDGYKGEGVRNETCCQLYFCAWANIFGDWQGF